MGGNIAILVSFYFNGEYEFPKNPYKQENQIFDESDAEEIIAGATGADGTELMNMVNKALRAVLRSHVNGYYKPNHTWDLDTIEVQDTGDIFMLEFQNAKQLKEYIDSFELAASIAANNAGGDDSFFDYMPGFVDIFAQLCEVTKQEKRYAKFIENLHKTNPHEIDYEFYRNTI